jgi:hypothetical protein
VTGGGGAAALDAQLPMTGTDFIPGAPSDASVDEEGVRGRCIIAAFEGTGLSIKLLTGAGKRVGSPPNTLKFLWSETL